MYVSLAIFNLLTDTTNIFRILRATTFGPRPRIVVSQIPAMLAAFIPDTATLPSFGEEKPTVLWEIKKMQDVWSMDSAGNSIVIGGNQRIVYAKDVMNPDFRTVQTPGKSDALSVCQTNVVRLQTVPLPASPLTV